MQAELARWAWGVLFALPFALLFLASRFCDGWLGATALAASIAYVVGLIIHGVREHLQPWSDIDEQ